MAAKKLALMDSGKRSSIHTSLASAIDFNADLKLWSPDNPKLYDVSIEADTDHINDQIGFRSIKTKGIDVLLNGRPIFLRGVS